MLTTTKGTIKKTKGPSFVIQEASTFKFKAKSKDNKEKGKRSKLKATRGIKKGKTTTVNEKKMCFYCGKDEHWKKNCKVYLASLEGNLLEGTNEKHKDE
ncbi:hypothetical protein F0562_012400 [Nyssa sinensis]|uniref:CCHC-type domain-containing protein n=1 Tax=Nyssa sinensis TaxID=561372 RepID=A0A5J4ZXF6_9ASTE|nr:hypothetical protein F0562_012400 [Nyssa sinensis]